MATELRRTSIARLSTDGDNMHAWETDEGETNAFAAPGRSGAMVIPQGVLELRAARVKTMRQKSARNK